MSIRPFSYVAVLMTCCVPVAGTAASADDLNPKGASAMTDSPNLVPNGSFEEVANGLPVGWAPGAPRSEIAPSVLSDTAFARSGRRSLCLSGDGKAGVVGWVTATCSDLRAGNMYELEIYYRTEDIPSPQESVWAYIDWKRDAKDERPRTAYLYSPLREGDWWRLSARYRAPEGATMASISLSLRHAPEGRVWFDDLSLRHAPSPAPRHVRIATVYLDRDTRGPEAWRSAVQKAGEGKADVVCLGELAQIVPSDPNARPTIPGPATDVLAALAREYRMMIVVSLPEWPVQDPEGPSGSEGQGPLRYNTAVIIGRDGSIVGRYRKVHLPQAEVEAGTTPGATIPVFDTDLGRIGLQVCYDHMFPEMARILALEGAEIIFTPIEGDIRSESKAYEAVARARALDNGVYYVTAICDTGRSLIVDPSGTILADTAGKQGVVFADIDLDRLFYEPWLSVRGYADFRHLWPKERRPALYGSLVQEPACGGPASPNAAQLMKTDPGIADLLAKVEDTEIAANLFHLSKDPLPYRKANFTRPGQTKSSLEEADEYIESKLRAWGYEVEKEACQAQAFRCDRSKPLHHWYSTPDPADPWYTLDNLYAKKRGTTKPDEIIVVISHKDSPSWIDSPGAHDNAAGTVGNMEVARLLAPRPLLGVTLSEAERVAGRSLRRSVWFVYCNEEHTPWTSVTAAQNARSRGDNIIAVLNLDGLGAKPQEATDAKRKTNALLYTTPEGEQLAELMMALNDAYGIGLEQVVGKQDSPSNDDGSYIKAGYPTALGIHGSFPFGDPNYHMPGDIPERVDVRNIAMAVQLALATILTLDARE